MIKRFVYFILFLIIGITIGPYLPDYSDFKKSDMQVMVPQVQEKKEQSTSRDFSQAPIFSPYRTFNIENIKGMEEINSIVGLPEMLYYWSDAPDGEALIKALYVYALKQGIDPMALFYNDMVESRLQASCQTQKTSDGSGEPFAVGIRQAIPENRKTMGITASKLVSMSAIDQLEAFKVLDDHKFAYLQKQGLLPDLETRKRNPIPYLYLRLIVMQPAVIDEYRRGDMNHIVFESGSNALKRNPSCDLDHKGSVDLEEFLKFHEVSKKNAMKEIPLYTMLGKIKHWKKREKGINFYHDEIEYFVKWIKYRIEENNKVLDENPEYLEFYNLHFKKK